MADLTWGDVVIVGGVAAVGFTLLSFWFSGLMNRKDWTFQVRRKKRRPDAGKPKA